MVKRLHVHAAPAKTQANRTPVLFTVPLTVMVFSGVARPTNEPKVLLLKTGFAVCIMMLRVRRSCFPGAEGIATRLGYSIPEHRVLTTPFDGSLPGRNDRWRPAFRRFSA